MRSSWVMLEGRDVAGSNDECPYKKQNWRHRHTQRERYMERQAEIGAMQLLAKEHNTFQQLPRMDQIPPSGTQKESTLPNP